LDLLSSGKFKFRENQFNISPFSKAAIKFQCSDTLSLTAISEAAAVTREEAALALKIVFTNFVEQGRSGKTCVLDLGVGSLEVKEGVL
jgi:hypothetical protein